TLGVDPSIARAVNDTGKVVGDSGAVHPNEDIVRDAFLFDGTRLRDVAHVPNEHSFAYGINDAGDIVGSTGRHAFVIRNGRTTLIPSFAGAGGRGTAFAVNSAGQVVGEAGVPPEFEGVTKAFLYSGGTLKSLAELGRKDNFS